MSIFTKKKQAAPFFLAQILRGLGRSPNRPEGPEGVRRRRAIEPPDEP